MKISGHYQVFLNDSMNKENTVFDLIILGGGPAGCAAAVYAARKKLHTVIVTDTFGGQSVVSEGIENWIGDTLIPGLELAKKLESHVRTYASEDFVIAEHEHIEHVVKNKDATFDVVTNKNTYTAKTVLVATGSHRRKLPVPGADQFEHKGITYCASCDGPFFQNKDVVVVGGGNAAFESAAQLLAYTKSVTLLQRGDAYRADEVTVEKVLAHENMRGLTGVNIKEVRGDKMVDTIVYEHQGKTIEQATDGIFVEIGAEPTTAYAKDVVDLTEYGQVITDPRTGRTSCLGVWSAGDCTDGLYHQNNIAAGDAVKALEDIYLYIKAQ